ncbi:RNA polymerase sigma factor [Actinocorallia longicatena]|uniref:Sigma-70 family RNA polymerase sigma factor n=1 Tax=Actinocorallia longicatena TaxID=111803 RepID=A0ABP6QL93_9ACTN
MTAETVTAEAAVADAHRREWAFVLAATVRVTRDLDLAEECVQDAYAKALEKWPADGVPAAPGAWLTTVARNRALDLVRRDATLRRRLPLLVVDALGGEDPFTDGPEDPFWAGAPDDRLRLIFTCCHPALAIEAQVALTLRLICGLTTAEVARAFLVGEATMAARITRAKKKISTAGIPYRVPSAGELPARTRAVLEVVHLMFTTGHTAPAGERLLRGDLIDRALDLTRMLNCLLGTDPEVTGLLALILLTDARRGSRLDAEGRLVLLADQDRTRWDHDAIAEGRALVEDALRRSSHRLRRRPGRFSLMAAIAAVHTGETTDWHELLGLYDLLLETWPSPVVALNRAVALSFTDGPGPALDALTPLLSDPRLASYGYLSATRADLLRRLGRLPEARDAYEEALLLTENQPERAFLAERLEAL